MKIIEDHLLYSPNGDGGGGSVRNNSKNEFSDPKNSYSNTNDVEIEVSFLWSSKRKEDPRNEFGDP